jgi:hypothetical protein
MPFVQSVTVSPEATNPTSWNALFQTLGFEGGLVIFLLALGLVVFILLGILFYRVSRWVFGPKGWAATAVQELTDQWKAAGKKVEDCLPGIQQALTQRNEVQSQQMGLCQEHKTLVVTTVKHQLSGLKEMADKMDSPEASREFGLALDAIK